jgi:hypothetical protein
MLNRYYDKKIYRLLQNTASSLAVNVAHILRKLWVYVGWKLAMV